MRVDLTQIMEAGGLKVKTKPGTLQESLKVGDTIDARVLSENRGSAVLKTADGQIVRARLSEGVSLSEGGEVTLEVTAKEEGFVYLSVSGKESEGQAMPEGTGTASAARGFEDKSLEPFALKLRELGMPVREETARVMRELIAANPNMSADEAAFIASNGISGDKTLMEAALSMLSSGTKTDELVTAIIKLLEKPGGTDIAPENSAEPASVQNEMQPKTSGAPAEGQKPLTDWITAIAERGSDGTEKTGIEARESGAEKPANQSNTSIPLKYTTMQNEISTLNNQKMYFSSENRSQPAQMDNTSAQSTFNPDINALPENPDLSGNTQSEGAVSSDKPTVEPNSTHITADTPAARQDNDTVQPQTGQANTAQRQPVTAENESVQRQPVTGENENVQRQPVTGENESARRQPVTAENESARRQPVTAENESSRHRPVAAENESARHRPVTADGGNIERQTIKTAAESLFMKETEVKYAEVSPSAAKAEAFGTEAQKTLAGNTVNEAEKFNKTPVTEQGIRQPKDEFWARESTVPHRAAAQEEILGRGGAEKPEIVLSDTGRFTRKEMSAPKEVITPPKAEGLDFKRETETEPRTQEAVTERSAPPENTVSKTLADILSEMPEFKGTPERALVRFSEMLLGAARDSAQAPEDFSEKLSVMLDKMFMRIEKSDEKAGERLKKAKDELFMRLSLVEETVSVTQSHPSKTELLEQTRKLMDHVRLVNNIEQFVYMQIPVKIGEERKTADLYLYKQKRGSKRIDPENVNILLSLDLDNVGHWESLVNVKGKDVSLRMEVSGEEIKECFSENTVMLHKLLEEAGFRLAGTSISFSKAETTPLTALSALDRFKSGRAGAFDYTI